MPRYSTFFRPAFERLETRDVPSTVTVRVPQTLRSVDPAVLGVNLTGWDGYLAASHYSTTNTAPDPTTAAILRNAGVKLVRLSNGSGTDEWHFDAPPSQNQFPIGAGTMARMAEAARAQAIVAVNFGTGTPQEAAAYLAYLNGAASNPYSFGLDANAKNWKTVSFWAGLRGQAPLANDDGYNHLRLSHPLPFNFQYFEVGNEAYFGAWQNYVTPSPFAYASFTKSFADLAAHIAPTVSIGVGLGNPGEWNASWNTPVLQDCANLGFRPGWISDHFYVFDGSNETPLSDQNLLLHSVSDAHSIMPIHNNAPRNWAGRASAYRAMLSHAFGAQAASIRLLCAEFNSDADASTKQTTSLVHGLFFADALGSILKTEYQGMVAWDLRNDYAVLAANPHLYGWRSGADDGMIGSPSNQAGAPQTGAYVAYPTYFAEQLVSKMVHTGDKLVASASSSLYISAYAVKQANGHLAVLVVNKAATATDAVAFNLLGFRPATRALVWSYGKADDLAQSHSPTGAAKLASATRVYSVFTITGGWQFRLALAPYSMFVIDVAPFRASMTTAHARRRVVESLNLAAAFVSVRTSPSFIAAVEPQQSYSTAETAPSPPTNKATFASHAQVRMGVAMRDMLSDPDSFTPFRNLSIHAFPARRR